MAEQEQPGLAGQLADVRRIVEVGFTETNGKLAVIALELKQGERRHEELAKTEAEHHRKVTEVLEEHDRRLQAAETSRAAEQAKAQTLVDQAKRFSAWVAIGVSTLGVVVGVVIKLLGGGS
ncbi:hypothetical protein ACQP10_38145 (plasmid) [Streptosporangium sandarakinum]|uniref:hypothetical protein n=1 Tax=Streptosporangium sandarakinum TaxID=1260955 RepID=UPI003D8A73E3